MIVRRSSFEDFINECRTKEFLGLDTETTGLRPYHGDRLFSIIISHADKAYYLNFKKDYADLPEPADDFVLDREHMRRLRTTLFSDVTKTWFIHNAANFDLPILGKAELFLAGTIHCTQAIARVEYGDHIGYKLANCLDRLGLAKSDAVEEYLTKHGLNYSVSIPGKAQKETVRPFHKVPFKIISEYGLIDGTGVYALGMYQLKSIEMQDAAAPALVKSNRLVANVLHNERRLQKTIFRMKDRGVKIDRKYCVRAAAWEMDRSKKAADEFKRVAGVAYSQSSKLFEEIFQSEKDKWSYTDKRNPSFDADALAKFDHPAAKIILEMRDAKSKADFYNGFIYHADADDVIHPNYNPDGTRHGRFSSSQPNFQNLTSEDEEEQLAQEFVIRRALIPRPGYVFLMPDYEQMEYKFMLENACRLLGSATAFSKLVAAGMDFHDATGQNVKNVSGLELVRKAIKIVNFMTLYGSGVANIADSLKIPKAQAAQIRNAILTAAPEVKGYLNAVQATAEQRGYIVNWLGRRCYFPRKALAYKAPNYHTSGGCADVVKVAMNQLDDFLAGTKSHMVMTVHDELPMECHESELATIPRRVKEIMEGAFDSKYVPLTSSMEWSDKSLADKVKGFPV